MSVNISVRIKKEKVKELDEVAEMLGLDRATVIRRVIDDGLYHERLNKAIDLYQKGDTMELAAKKTGLGQSTGCANHPRQRGNRRSDWPAAASAEPPWSPEISAPNPVDGGSVSLLCSVLRSCAYQYASDRAP